MSITIRDVAQRAGVSVATVSRVINRSGVVSEETRRRVEAASVELRYHPHGAARSLITRRTNAFGVVLPDLYGEFFSEVIRGMDPLARESGYHLLLSSSHDDLRQIQLALGAMRGRVDGLIVMSPNVTGPELEAWLPPDLPVVLLNCDVRGSPFPAINVDNYGGALSLVRHLVGLGHRRIAMVKGVESNFDARERLRGFRAAVAEVPGVEAVEVDGDFTEDGGWRAAGALMARDPRPSAIFCANDSMAVGAISALGAAGLRVPDDVAVAGFDDVPIARYLAPPLSSVRVDVHRLGARAVQLLSAAVAGESDGAAPAQELLPTRLAVRRSCGADGPPGTPVS